MNYPQLRSRSVLINLALWLVICAAGLAVDVGRLVENAIPDMPWVLGMGLVLLVYVLINFPFDLYSGFRLPEKFGRSSDTFADWLKKWGRGAGVHYVYLVFASYTTVLMAQWLGWWGSIVWVSFQMIFLMGFQQWMARGIAKLTAREDSDRGRPVLHLGNTDIAFTGGISGLPGKETLVLPEYWQQKFPEKINKVLLARRHGAINTGSHGKGTITAFFWNLALFAAAVLLSRHSIDTLAGWIEVTMYFSLFSILTLIGPLPALSRRAVRELDRWVFYQGFDADALRESFPLTYRLQDADEKAGTGIRARTIRIPTQTNRLASMAEQADVKGAWNTAALAVYLSWAGVNLLARSGRSVAGRPELWVFLPGD